MKQDRLKAIDFNQAPIYYITDNGVNYVLIRPLCEALGVDADRQIRDMKEDEILGPEVSGQTTQVPGDSQSRKWICLPEEWIYGWLFGIKMTNTMREETKLMLTAYKRECYKILYNHFHGPLTKRVEAIRTITETEREIRKLTSILNENEDYQRLLQLRSIKSGHTKKLSLLDKEIREGQKALFDEGEE